MENNLHLKLFKITSVILMFFLSFSLFGQGEIIPLTVRENITVRGDMTITGNTILGVRGTYNEVNFGPNQDYNLEENNGSTNFRDINDFSFFFFGTIVSNGTIYDYNRAYVDIDDDPTFRASGNLSAGFLANSSNSVQPS